LGNLFNEELHENSTRSRQVVPCRQTYGEAERERERHTDTIFHDFGKAPKKGRN